MQVIVASPLWKLDGNNLMTNIHHFGSTFLENKVVNAHTLSKHSLALYTNETKD